MCFQKPRRPDDFCVVFTSCLLPATFPGSFCSLLAHNAQRSPTAHSRKVKATLNSHHNQFLNYVKQIVWQRVGETVLQVLRLQRRCTCAFSGLAFTIFCQHLCAKTHTDAWNVHLRVVRVWDFHPGLKQQPSGSLIGVRTAFVKAANRNAETCVLLKAGRTSSGWCHGRRTLFCKLVTGNRYDGAPTHIARKVKL